MKRSWYHSKKIQLDNNYETSMYSCFESPEKTSTTYSRQRSKIVFFLFFFIFFFLITFNDFSYNVNNKVKNITLSRTPVKEIMELTFDNIKLELNHNHIICPEQVYAQIMIESGHLTSFLTKRTNNILGMRYPFKRSTSAVGLFLPASNLIVKGTKSELKKYKNQNNYAVYASWEDCIKDYKYWQDASFNLTERYLKFLGKYYAEDTQYVEKIKQLSR